ncbi:ATP-binding protein [Parapedobacter deserti]|uniref:histidine kinase n=1 Tax=Parapedobacter deserti TaxID=1912957 RepID=A0ABV7JQ95_9SPHI
MDDASNPLGTDAMEDFEDFFQTAICGLIITDAKGKILRVNKRIATWRDEPPEMIEGRSVSDLLTIAGKIYFETHLWPLLRMQGFFDEVAVELADTTTGKLPVFLNGYERRNEDGVPLFMRFMLFRAADRRLYEENLKTFKAIAEEKLAVEKKHAVLREQFIAVLGHDLRNPLGAIDGVAQLMGNAAKSDAEKQFARILNNGVKRMKEMIENVMDFARGRLGGGFDVTFQNVNLRDLLTEVVDEIKSAWPGREINLSCNSDINVVCDPARIAQLVSNLLANAITHGAPTSPIDVIGKADAACWSIAVANKGKVIPDKDLPNLFLPFNREKSRPSQQGLGLGLYIASEIAKAHQGRLEVASDDSQTCFTLTVAHPASIEMPRSTS